MSAQDDPRDRGAQYEHDQRPGRSDEERERDYRRNRHDQDEYDERNDQENDRGWDRRDRDRDLDEQSCRE